MAAALVSDAQFELLSLLVFMMQAHTNKEAQSAERS